MLEPFQNMLILDKVKNKLLITLFFLLALNVHAANHGKEEAIEVRIYSSPEAYQNIQIEEEERDYYFLPLKMARLGHYVEIEYRGVVLPLHQLDLLPYHSHLAPNHGTPKLNMKLMKKNSSTPIILPDHISENIVKIILHGVQEIICDCYCFAGILQGSDAYSNFVANNTNDLSLMNESPIFKPGDFVQPQIYHDGSLAYNHIATNIGEDLFISKTGLFGYLIISDLELIKTKWGSKIIHHWPTSPLECDEFD
ncbi:hypothetical protein [Parendozoicomonas haliclonae]|uniref:Uncharacterized protein n=1 Tax=Parendozoicomonas haliclonae TaxID=1960125 RepID=A0A1X7AFN7_9GAMM|nr:hypothetical protein [Parendozoicomonas haliclonae]SMA38179.1 hypothetical protein EHSB41UT_00849 [Parendozoicomonas haliclonae]